jgi:hypothetical protein
MAKGGKGPKDPWEKLEKNLKEGMESMSDEDLKKRVSVAALERAEQTALMKEDQHIKEVAFQLGEAKKTYTDQIKGADLIIKYAKHLLEARGKL